MRASILALVAALVASALGECTEQDDIVIGTVFSGRTAVYSNSVGHFVNTVALRIAFNPKWTLGEIIVNTQQKIFAAAEHQEAAFSDVVAALNPRREPSEHPLFSVLCIHGADETAPAELAGEFSLIEDDEQTTRFPLEISSQVVDGRLQLSLRHDRACVEDHTVRTIAGVLKRGIQAYSKDPTRTVTEVLQRLGE